MYYNVNNLYDWAMCQPLPYANFRWVDDIQNFNFTTIALDSATGYILEVDAECSHLHDAHLPFCPTREKLPSKRDNKPFATLCDKQRYVIHYRNLQSVFVTVPVPQKFTIYCNLRNLHDYAII